MKEQDEKATQITVYFPPSVLAEIAEELKRTGKSRSQWIVEAAREKLERERKAT